MASSVYLLLLENGDIEAGLRQPDLGMFRSFCHRMGEALDYVALDHEHSCSPRRPVTDTNKNWCATKAGNISFIHGWYVGKRRAESGEVEEFSRYGTGRVHWNQQRLLNRAYVSLGDD